MSRRVAITGYGAVTPLGVGAGTLVERWADGACGIEDGKASCREFDPLQVLSRKEARRADRFAQLAIAAAAEALADSGLSGPDGELAVDPGRVGCIVGTGIGGLASLEREEGVLRERGPKAVSPLAVPLMMGNAAAAALAMRFGVRGEAYGVVSACAAGAHAIGVARGLIESGRARAVVTGGAESASAEIAEAAFASMGATSPTGVSRPFDARRDGFVMGEGAGILVLEEMESALARGAEVKGELLGYGATCDAFHLTAPDPGGEEAARAIGIALGDAGVSPEELDYVNAHGTSTPLNDRSETEALKLALGDAARSVPVSSTKSAIGHLLGAAGAVEAIATVESLRRGVAPPTLGWEQPDEGLDLDYVPDGPRPLPGPGGEAGGRRVAISNSFGFGGHNAVLCLAA